MLFGIHFPIIKCFVISLLSWCGVPRTLPVESLCWAISMKSFLLYFLHQFYIEISGHDYSQGKNKIFGILIFSVLVCESLKYEARWPSW